MPLKVTMATDIQTVTVDKREPQNELMKLILPGIQRAVMYLPTFPDSPRSTT